MIGMSAVIFIPDDTAKTGYPQPLMLQSVMGAPLLAWLANALFDSRCRALLFGLSRPLCRGGPRVPARRSGGHDHDGQ